MEWLNKLVDTIHEHGTDYAQVDRSRTTWQLVSSSPGCIRKSYHNWPSLVSSLPEFAEMPCVAFTELVAGYQCISCRSGHLLVLFTGAVLGNTNILHCQTLSVIPLPLVRPPLVFILSKTQSSGRLTNQSKHGYFFWQHLFPIQSVGIPQGGLCVSYAWHLSKFWQT